MKSNNPVRSLSVVCRHLWLTAFAIGSMAITNHRIWAQEPQTHASILDSMVATARTENLEHFNETARSIGADRARIGAALVAIFKDPKSSNLNRCASTYYLGEMRFGPSVDVLAKQIDLQLDSSRYMNHDYPVVVGWPVVDALIKIGSASIPAVVRNLAESDEPQMRNLSLKVLYRIEGDKDIVQLRLQKALDNQQDTKQKTRLQLAIQALTDSQFDR